jgi:hypothetical protein
VNALRHLHQLRNWKIHAHARQHIRIVAAAFLSSTRKSIASRTAIFLAVGKSLSLLIARNGIFTK